MSEIKHSPLPWASEDCSSGTTASDHPTIGYVGDYRIVRDGAWRYDNHADDADDANFVVLACNAFEASQARIASLDRLVEAARKAIQSWDSRLGTGEVEQLKIMLDTHHEYWSPSASMVDSSCMAELRAALLAAGESQKP